MSGFFDLQLILTRQDVKMMHSRVIFPSRGWEIFYLVDKTLYNDHDMNAQLLECVRLLLWVWWLTADCWRLVHSSTYFVDCGFMYWGCDANATRFKSLREGWAGGKGNLLHFLFKGSTYIQDNLSDLPLSYPSHKLEIHRSILPYLTKELDESCIYLRKGWNLEDVFNSIWSYKDRWSGCKALAVVQISFVKYVIII